MEPDARTADPLTSRNTWDDKINGSEHGHGEEHVESAEGDRILGKAERSKAGQGQRTKQGRTDGSHHISNGPEKGESKTGAKFHQFVVSPDGQIVI